MKKLWLKHYKNPRITQYLGNLIFLFVMVFLLELSDYHFHDTGLTLIETLIGSGLIFVMMAIIYSIVSPTFLGWIRKKWQK